MTTTEEILAKARDTIHVQRVFGEPYEKNGVTLIPAVAVRGGGGAGEGEDDQQGGGKGGGFGVSARPVGAYQIKGDEVTWIPAADTTRVVIIGQFVVIVGLFVLRSIVRARRKKG